MVLPEFSRVITLGDISLPFATQIVATLEECKALTKRVDAGVEALAASLVCERADDRISVKVQGKLSAQVTLICGVTLLPFSTKVEDEFVVYFSPSDHPDVGNYEKDDQEFYEKPEIDVGEVVTQYLCIALPSYARRPDVSAVVPRRIQEDHSASLRENPFAALKAKLDKCKGDS